jgi:predicted permease
MPSTLRAALRTLRTAPGFAAAVVLTLALGIALATAMGTVARAVAFARFPVRAQDRVVVLWGEQSARRLAHRPLGWRAYERFAAEARGVDATAALDYYGGVPRLFRPAGAAAGDDRPLRLTQAAVSGNLFPLLGVVPALGRTLRPDDDVPGGPGVLVLSHAAWRRDFGGDPRIVGRALWSVERRAPYTVVGVMPPGLDFPRGVDAWTPLLPYWAPTGRIDEGLLVVDVIARLAPGATVAQAAAELTTFFRREAARGSPAVGDAVGTARTLATAVVGDARPAFGATAGAAALVLAIACVNVTGLVLVRAARRRRELAVRASVGAGRGRLVAQLVAEHAVLAGLAGVLGAVLAAGLVRAFAALAPADLPRVAEVRVDPALLAAAAGLTALVVLLVGLLPALGASRVDVADVLRGDGRGASGGLGARRTRRALVAAQAALAVVVLAGAGLLGRSFARLRAADLGIAADRLALVQLLPPSEPGQAPGPTDASRWHATLDALVARVAAIPGVRGVAPVAAAPFAGSGGWDIPAEPEGAAAGDSARTPWLNMEVTTADFRAASGVPLLQGRFLSAADREGAPGAVVLSAAAARAMWPDAAPAPGGAPDVVGRRVRLGGPRDPLGWRTVVGVVGETRYRDLVAPRPSVYIPYRQFPAAPTHLAVRAAGDPAAVVPAVRRAVAEVAPGVLVTRASTMRELVAAPLARPRLLAALLGAFAAAALVLTAVGLYAVAAASAAQRGRELGVRAALGARPGDLRRLVLGEGLGVAAAGAAVGLGAALALSRLVGALLFEVAPVDPATFALVPALLLAVCALACLGPARRAARADPMRTLRAE